MFSFDSLVTLETDASSIARTIGKICRQCDVSENVAIEAVRMTLWHMEEQKRARHTAEHHCACSSK